MSTTTPDTITTRPYLCPDCGANEWRAWYPEYATQGVTLAAGDDGVPFAEDYVGDYDGADCTFENESYECLVCGHEISMGHYEWVPLPAPKHTRKKTDEELREILRARAEEIAAARADN
jgi:DNA-directed RNA polymerase subunit RPC12/RpoP